MRYSPLIKMGLLALVTAACSAGTDAHVRTKATANGTSGTASDVGTGSDEGSGDHSAAVGSGTSDEAIGPAGTSANVSGLYLASCSADTNVSFVGDARVSEEVTACRITQNGKDVPPESIVKIEIQDKAGVARDAVRVAKTTTAPWTLGFKLPLEETSTVSEVRFVVGNGSVAGQAKAEAFDFPWTSDGAFTSFLEALIADFAKGIASSFVAEVFPEVVIQIASGALKQDPSVIISPEEDFGTDGGEIKEGMGGPLFPDLALPTTRVVFASSEAFAANFGGAAFADERCLRLAQAAKLVGSWRAYLDSAQETAAARLGIDELSSFQLVNGTVVAKTGTQLRYGPLEAPLDLDENAQPISVPISVGTLKLQQFALQAWNGSASGNCDEWASTTLSSKAKTADLLSKEAGWLGATVRSCARIARLICVRD